MRKNILIIFFIIVLGLIFFNVDFCLATLNKPTNLRASSVGEANATLKWYWSDENGGTLKQFKFLYKAADSIIWTARYPEEGSDTTITYNLMGLLEKTTYQWRVLAQAEDPADDSSLIDGPPFETTISSLPPPVPEENGNGGGFLQDMELKNPLSQDTFWEAMDAVLNFLILASFVIVPILIIYAGFLMLFSAGDATKISRGKEIIFWTVIAVAIILFAKGLPSIIKGIFIS